MPKQEKHNWTAAELSAAISTRYPSPAWTVLREVPNATSGRKQRTADALAIGLWHSRGLDLIGFEIKISRNDWVKELRNPSKAEAIAKYCDYWYLLVSSPDIVKQAELPTNWGLMAPRGRSLAIVKEAVRLDPQPIDRSFLAAIARKIGESHDAIVASASKLGYARGYKDGSETMEQKQESAIWKSRYEQLKSNIEELSQRTGIDILGYRWHTEEFADRFKLASQVDYCEREARRIQDVKSVANQMKAIAEVLREHLARAEAALKGMEK